MPVTPESIGQAIMDVQRRKRDMPTRQENVEALALAAIKKKQEMAALGLSEEELANRPELRGQESAKHEAGLELTGEQTRSAGAAADLSEKKLTDPLEVTGGSSLMTPEGGIVGTAPKQFDPRSGKQYKIDTVDEHGNAVQRIVEGDVGMEWPKGPTAEARNMEIQGAAVDPAFETMLTNLDVFEEVMGGDPGFLDRAGALIPGTQAYWARDNFVKSARALAGAIVARQAGEGSRLSDEDRRAYSEAAAVVNSVIVLPGGIEEARRRLTAVRKLLANIQARRKAVSSNTAGMSDFGDETGGGANRALDVANAGGGEGGTDEVPPAGVVRWGRDADGNPVRLP